VKTAALDFGGPGVLTPQEEEIIKVSVTCLHSGCYRPVLYSCGYSMCQELRRQRQNQISQLMQANQLLSDLHVDGSTSAESCARCSSLGESEAEFDSKHTVSTDALLKAAGVGISRVRVAATIGFSNVDACSTLESVSAEFEDLSGYYPEELLGKPMRVLTRSCPEDALDVMASNISNRTGAETITDVCIQTKSGDLKACRVLRRGLTLGFDPELGKRLWVLLSIYVDLSKNGECPDMHISEISEAIREEISKAVGSLDKMNIPDGSWHTLPSCPWVVAVPSSRSITAPP